MDWSDVISTATKVGSAVLEEGATLADRGFAAANEWAEKREADRRMAEFDDRIEKAAKEAIRQGLDGTHELKGNGKGAPARDPKAMHFDPFDVVAAMGYRHRPSRLTYATMERVGKGFPVVADIIGTRVKQVGQFCDLPEDRHSPGFRVRRRDFRTNKPSKKDRKRAQELEQLVLHTGYYVPEEPHKATSLIEFSKVFVRDSLTYDQATFEIIPDRDGKPSYLALADSATFRLIDPAARKPGEAFAVQVIDGVIAESFTADELAFCVRNPSSGIKSYGYGTSEIETLVREITGLLYGMDYNRKAFSNGSATKGILNFRGTVPDKHLRAFRRQWYAMVSGIGNAWRTPITNAEELQWINMQMSNRDMEFSAWIDFLIKIACARFNIATEEVNFSYGNTGQSQAMGQAPIEEKVKQSRDQGLRPLIRWFFNQINIHYLWKIDPRFEVVPVGFNEKGEEAEAELLGKQTKIFLTVNEARERAELEPLPDEQGDVILDPTWLQYVQGKEAMAAEEEPGFGDEGEDPFGGGDPGADLGFDITDL